MVPKKPMTWGEKRKLVIILGISFVSVSILSLIVFFVFYNKPATCFDTKQNQNEQGVDCGGVCSAVCKNNVKDVLVKWVRIFPGKEGYYSVLASIENTNDAVVFEAPYSLKISDDKSNVIGEKKGSVFIPKRKSFLVFEPNIDTKGIKPMSAYFGFEGGLKWQTSSYEEPKLDISKQVLSDDGIFSRLEAEVNNPNIEAVKNINFIATLYDDENNAIDASKTFLEKIDKYASAPIVFSWPRTLPVFDRVCVTPVDVSIVIDRSGSMDYLSKDPPQPLTDVKNAADFFVSQLSKKDQFSIISFANEAKLESQISDIFIVASTTQNTNLTAGLLKADEELNSPRHKEGLSKVAIILTDGVATRPVKTGDNTYPETSALLASKQMKAEGVTVFSIGLGKEVNQEFLKSLSTTPENTYFAPTALNLKNIYQSIATKICKKGTSRIEITPSIPL